MDIVANTFRSVSQIYVENLKASVNFVKETQIIEHSKAKNIALEQMTDEVKQFITKNFSSVDHWLTTTIKSTINLVKNKKYQNLCRTSAFSQNWCLFLFISNIIGLLNFLDNL